MVQNSVVAAEFEYQLELSRFPDRMNVEYETQSRRGDFKGLSQQEDGVTSDYHDEDG